MLDSLTNAVQIIDANIADARQRGADVDKDERDIARFQVVEKGLFHAERDDGDAVDATLNHATDGMGKTPGVVNGGAGEDFVVVLDGDIFKSLNNLGEERIGDFGDDEAKDAAASGDKGARLRVREIAKLLDDFPDAPGELGSDGGNAVNRPRNGGDGNLRAPGNFVDAQLASVLQVPRTSNRPVHRAVHVAVTSSRCQLLFSAAPSRGAGLITATPCGSSGD